MDWVLEPEVKILTVGIMRVKLVSRGCPTGSKEEGVISILWAFRSFDKRVYVFRAPRT
jgi:hypothetical protein